MYTNYNDDDNGYAINNYIATGLPVVAATAGRPRMNADTVVGAGYIELRRRFYPQIRPGAPGFTQMFRRHTHRVILYKIPDP